MQNMKDTEDNEDFQGVELSFLNPGQLIAMRDYPPLHSPEAFGAYMKKFKAGEKVEPVIVIPASAVIIHLQKNADRFKTYGQELERFLDQHPSAAFFMLGGKHRSAAATLLGFKIPCLVVQGDADIKKIHAFMAEGRLTGVPSVGTDFEDTLTELDNHYFEHKVFWNMEEKTQAMVENGDISKEKDGRQMKLKRKDYTTCKKKLNPTMVN